MALCKAFRLFSALCHLHPAVQVETLLPKDLSKFALHMPPELAALMAHPETLDPLKIPVGSGWADLDKLRETKKC